MTKLKLGPILEDKPVKVTVELPAQIYRDLEAYAAALAHGDGTGTPVAPDRLIAPMISRFMATDRVFAKLRRSSRDPS
jgi:hypothetical protein